MLVKAKQAQAGPFQVSLLKIMKYFLPIVFFLLAAVSVYGQVAEAGKPLPAWQKGYLDLHHINTGRGNAAFYILPDGTTMLVDAGELSPLDSRTFTPRNAVIRPNDSKKPYEWIAEYIRQVAPAGDRTGIDYAVLTHFHDDHFGAWYPDAPLSPSKQYRLTGITGVGTLLPVRMLIDRGYPGYTVPFDMRKKAADNAGGEIAFGNTMDNYFRFQAEQQQEGMRMAGLKAGSRDQLVLLHDTGAYPSFYIRNIKCNQWIWTGRDSSVSSPFPPQDTANKATWPDENSLSLALTIHYGPFTYYTGGDNPGNVFFGEKPWRDVETPMARAIGEVDVATMDHHGNRDAVNEFQVRTFRPQVWIGQTWSADHPGHEVLVRMTTPHLYTAPRDLFATNMLDANRHVIGPLIDRSYKSQQGHIVVRVLPGGDDFYVIILNDSDRMRHVKAVYGPYHSKKKP